MALAEGALGSGRRRGTLGGAAFGTEVSPGERRQRSWGDIHETKCDAALREWGKQDRPVGDMPIIS